MKKILFILESLKDGGAEKVLIDLLRNFDYSYYEVTLLLLFKKGTYLEDVPSEVKILNVYDESLSIFTRLCMKFRLDHIKHIFQKYLVNKCLQGRKFDTIVSFMEGLSTVIHSYLFNRASHHVTWVHIDLKAQNWCAPFFDKVYTQRDFYTKVDNIIFVSAAAKKSFNDLFDIDKGQVIYNIIDSDLINSQASEYRVEKNKFTICNIGRLAIQKRQDRLIEAVSLLRNKGYDLQCWILGTGCEREKLEKQIKDFKLESVVQLLGFKKNPYPFVKAADLFVLSSDTEGFSLVVCESLCIGTPVLSTKITGPTEVLYGGKYGILCECNPIEIAQEIEKFILDQEYTKKYRKLCMERMNFFSIPNTMVQVYSIL